MREEYLAITNAGIIVQIDEPSFAENWDQFASEPSLADYQKFTMVRVEALNHALRGIPRELVRFHCCWGSWHGPHSTDIGMADLVDMLVQIDAGSYSFEAANARHEHEWRIWKDAPLPDDVVLVPGVVGHATNVLEHPSSWPTASSASPTRSVRIASSPRPTAASAGGCTRRSPGRSSRRWRRARSSWRSSRPWTSAGCPTHSR